ncbi:hypothetical protein [Mucilaginibacter agri]|uniref:SWIM-type domain-containing protein n=1 Tax=Mucilaginibacter agri TaxID=2695265 RepID=A0A966DQB9_9SPHI|nr:hypothetical protein [Mucilaginibacter agri]NCD67883.1 hypothetical protein [Mucilaginibacter agri]
MKRNANPETVLPADLFFYTIPYGNPDMMLYKETMYEHFGHTLPNKRHSLRTQTTCLSYHDDLFTVTVQLPVDERRKLFIHVGRNALEVACECGMPGEHLCAHAYYSIMDLMHYKNTSLKDYYWAGLQSEIKGKHRFLDVQINSGNIKIKPKQVFGNLYKSGLGFEGADKLNLKTYPIKPKTDSNRNVLGFALLYFSGGSIAKLPILIPFTATTNKSGTDIAYYDYYLRSDRPYTYNGEMTTEQLMLCEFCYEMFRLTKKTGKQPYSNNPSEEWVKALPNLFKLWQRALPLLSQERFLKSCINYGTWNDKPRKFDMKDCRIYAKSFSIGFILKDRCDYFTLEKMIKVSETDSSEDLWKMPLFVFNWREGNYYLVDSLRDEEVLNWVYRFSNKMTIMRADLNDLHNRFIAELSSNYEVLYLPYKGKKPQAYNSFVAISDPENS